VIEGSVDGVKRNLSNSTLIVEEGLDFLRKSMGITNTVNRTRSDAALALKEADTDQIIRRSLERSLAR